jgi:integrase/recombinase XerD
MATATASTSLVPVQPVFTDAERLALAGFLAGYRGLTREAYTLDLRRFTGWCRARSLPLFSVRRADIETFAREMEGLGRARATVTRRLCTIAGFYKYAVEEELLDHSPAAHVRRPRLDYESHATTLGPQRARRAPSRGRTRAARRARPHLAARPQRAAGLGGHRRGYRAPGPRARAPHPVDHSQGGKVVTIPLAPRTGRAIDLATGERTEGPLFTTADGRRLDRHGAARIVRRVTRRAGIAKHVGPHTLRQAFITAALDAGVPLRDVQGAASHADPRTTMRYDRARTSLDRHATYIVATYIAGAARWSSRPDPRQPGCHRRPDCPCLGTRRKRSPDVAADSAREPPLCMAAGSAGVAAGTVTERSFCVPAGSMPGRRRARGGAPRRAAVSGPDVTASAAAAWRGSARIVRL